MPAGPQRRRQRVAADLPSGGGQLPGDRPPGGGQVVLCGRPFDLPGVQSARHQLDGTRIRHSLLLAFAAWRAGEGAVASIAVSRALSADPEYPLARLMAQALAGGLSPAEWEAAVRELPVA